MKLGKIFGFLTSLVLLAVTIVVYTQRQDISDWIVLRDYVPAGEIEKLATDSNFSALGKKLFYVHDPDLLGKESFFGKCQEDEKSSVLGCYYSGNKIYLLKVIEEKLEGIEEVTASHEMLHAAYDRLGEAEKLKINKLLDDVYRTLPEDSHAKKDIATYDESDKNVFYNELHSIIGTEVRVLPAELEQYYILYFVNRSSVVGFAEKYAAEFDRLQNSILDIDTRLNTLKTDLDQSKTNLEFLYAAIEEEGRMLDSKSNDPSAFNAALPSYNNKVIEYRSLSNEYNRKVETYNSLIEERKAIAIENNELYDAIDTRLPVVE